MKLFSSTIIAAAALGLAAIAALPGLVPTDRLYALGGWLISEGGAAIDNDVAYGPGPRRRLDVYRPRGAKASPDRPVILFVYGGSWTSGSKDTYRFVGTALANRGYTTVIPDYRLYPEVRWPHFVEDVAQAYAWVEKNLLGKAKGRRIVIVGHSAGAHTAALLALQPEWLRKAGADPNTLSKWVGLSGPYAFEPTTYPSTREIFATARSSDAPRPIVYVSPGDPPALLVHGLADETVRLWNLRQLAGQLRESGVPVETIELPEATHIGPLFAFSTVYRMDGLLDDIVSFLESSRH